MDKSAAEGDDAFSAASSKSESPPAFAKAVSDERKEARLKVNWMARLQLPSGQVVAMRVSDISEGGIGLAGDTGIPPHSVLRCAVAVPGLSDPAQITPLVGTIRTTHATIRGPDLIYGGTWVRCDADAKELLSRWIRRLRH